MSSDTFASFAAMTSEEVFGIDPREAAGLQLEAIRERYLELRPQLRVLASVADDVGVDRIDQLDDVVPLCLPHTIYKSYSQTYIERGRYDRLTRWLDGLTTEDLSGLDTSGCDSLESWLDAVEATSRLRPLVSSGTSGKVSFFPRGQIEQDRLLGFTMQTFSGYRDELDTGLDSGVPDMFAPLPMATGRQSLPRVFELICARCFDGDTSRIHTRGRGHWDVDMLWLSGRLRAAAAQGQTIDLAGSPRVEMVRDRLAAIQARAAEENELFFEELMIDHRGRQIVLFAPTATLVDLSLECRRRSLDAQFAERSCIITGGGTKGQVLPDGWEALVGETFPLGVLEMYSMTETTASTRLCSAGGFHYPASVVLFVLDPDNGRPLPRTGTQTGRLAVFDICAETHWGGAITGDRVTVSWDDDCRCGRRGPRIANNVTRYSDLRDDDKITCARSPGAYERAVETLAELS
jgi:hypothetical protein